jgi:hypothetical protein
MSNGRGKGTSVTLEQWINTPGIRKGILAVYANEPFDYDDNRVAYEIGRQIALLAKEAGLTTRGSILRRKPKSQQMAIVKTKMTILSQIVYRQLMFRPEHLALEMY